MIAGRVTANNGVGGGERFLRIRTAEPLARPNLLPPPFFSFNFVSTPITISFGRLCLSQDVHSNLSSFRGQEISHFLPYSSRRRENQTLVGVVLHFLFFSPNRVDSILSISDTNFVQFMYLVLTFASRRVQIQVKL